MRVGQSYVCQNQACRCEVEVVKASTEAAPNPRCCCGAEMRKEYKKPAFKILDKQPDSFPLIGFSHKTSPAAHRPLDDLE
jgi:hypothetical protein